MKPQALSRWTADQTAELYGIRNWGSGYFDVSERGDLLVRPQGAGSTDVISMMDVVEGLKARGIGMPVLLRFGDILASRIAAINNSFSRAMTEAGYQGRFRGVYPIKVNQQQQVIEDVVAFGRPFHHGLEAGSKAELITALAYCNNPESLIVCNGYKDEEFIDLALYALKMGMQTVMVIEMPSELPMILDRAGKIGVKPRIGVRAKLAAKGGGHWNESGGDRSQFGLNAAQIIDLVDYLRGRNALDCLEMLHYHLGSQIPNIRNVRSGAIEAGRMYVNLVKEGARMGLMNVGGGLAVDYDGSHSNFASSANYKIDEYAADIVETLQQIADQAGVPHPDIVSESGRATVAHHSVLLFDIFDVSRMNIEKDEPLSLPEDAGEHLKALKEVLSSLNAKNVQECYHDAVFHRDEVRSLFNQGQVTLRERALAEKIFWQIIMKIAEELQDRKYIPDELQDLETVLADVYFGNFSVFQSLPDSWAIEQLFPIIPIHRMNEMPTRKAVLADITCDCDGKIDRFIDLHDVRRTLPLHEMNGKDYILGVFLVGAYQETLGDLHNLLGDTNVVSVRLGSNGQPEYVREIAGDTVADVLSYVEYDPGDMIHQMRQTAEQAVRNGRITPQERREIMMAYETGLRGYTYFEK
ncbi:MAG TPA: biosynthetic arginine decarboxylase [Kiritimatiellia bacterium]|nr:biosynthetic arginine decarboxylase [Kiritimatiellia bacterium]HMO98304.1 biosynthetic arginine decarboxylase [Kiritimatiellia bacterium]HMP95500.1 biosynthetic arginine decarboxylase [Kiritimatiellia bacterium]